MFRKAIELLKTSRTVVLTGAGISTPSGIPDFRSKNGLYQKYGQEIFDIKEFYSNPSRFYNFAKEAIFPMISAKPNLAHNVLACLEKNKFVSGIITQNIDNLHQKAGSANVIELHGNVSKYYCVSCKKHYKVADVLKLMEQNDIPICECSGLIRPDIVFFGEELPEQAWNNAVKLVENSDLMLVIGSSLVVYPAAYLPVFHRNRGGKIIIVNKGLTELDEIATVKLEMDVIEFAEMVERALC
ncbi:NAD-dependent protein deacylase [Thermosipho ferrireducens]|uniref:protein acetyllysine N-acetyltransferase n=1 Tax=Thermosipho ferrireducens TaxID=2571116 RepID=A0ABX7S5W1_9BACT|nr:NAD-dependent protein deacylase [Thermosipho ferrireducens]QTA37963.1 NAD-dependent protein deacylase [Thermosipho ferrireducens]